MGTGIIEMILTGILFAMISFSLFIFIRGKINSRIAEKEYKKELKEIIDREFYVLDFRDINEWKVEEQGHFLNIEIKDGEAMTSHHDVLKGRLIKGGEIRVWGIGSLSGIYKLLSIEIEYVNRKDFNGNYTNRIEFEKWSIELVRCY